MSRHERVWCPCPNDTKIGFKKCHILFEWPLTQELFRVNDLI